MSQSPSALPCPLMVCMYCVCCMHTADGCTDGYRMPRWISCVLLTVQVKYAQHLLTAASAVQLQGQLCVPVSAPSADTMTPRCVLAICSQETCTAFADRCLCFAASRANLCTSERTSIDIIAPRWALARNVARLGTHAPVHQPRVQLSESQSRLHKPWHCRLGGIRGSQRLLYRMSFNQAGRQLISWQASGPTQLVAQSCTNDNKQHLWAFWAGRRVKDARWGQVLCLLIWCFRASKQLPGGPSPLLVFNSRLLIQLKIFYRYGFMPNLKEAEPDF